MMNTPIDLQDLRRRLYAKAKAEPSWRFWGLYVHVCKRETLREAYRLAKANDGAPGIDGVRFESIEAEGVEGFLDQLHQELVERRYRPGYGRWKYRRKAARFVVATKRSNARGAKGPCCTRCRSRDGRQG